MLLLAFSLAACVDEGAEEVTDDTLSVVAPEAQVEGEHDPSPEEADYGAQANRVLVYLESYVIDMPQTLPAGPTRFEITNRGDAAHSFAIAGQGIEKALEADVEPEETQQLRADLVPGTYRVWCPVGNHAERGMVTELIVTEADPATGEGAPGGQP